MMTGPLATLFQLAYSLMLIGVGCYGIFTAPWELATLYGVDENFLASEKASTLLNQFRFLKAAEAGFGFFCLFHRKDILIGGTNSLLFLTGCGLGIFARSWSWIVDGTPDTMFIWFLALEVITFVFVWAYARRDRF